MRRLSGLKEEVRSWRSLDEKATSLGELLALSIEEKDDSLRATFSEELADIQRTLAEIEFKLVLSGPYDQRNAIMALHAGAGGVESQDWASRLMRRCMRGDGRRRRTLGVRPTRAVRRGRRGRGRSSRHVARPHRRRGARRRAHLRAR